MTNNFMKTNDQSKEIIFQLAWYAVAAYYFSIGKQDPVRKYIGKATSINRIFGYAWLLYGHSFGVENEHDQAMAAYFTASKIMEG